MNSGGKINIEQKPIRVLLVPLDWGLGHATRCVPIVNRLIKDGVDVWVAGEENRKEFFVKLLPNAVFFPLKGYRVNYAANKDFFTIHLLAQFFKIKSAIRDEHNWLNNFVDEHQIDAVISDNRFGLWTNKRPSVFITHQLNIQTGNKFLDWIARKINQKFICRFKECWLMDTEKNGLAGSLAHSTSLLPFPVKYLGLSSRFEKKIVVQKDHVLFLLSGPEPSRTIFEQKILKEISKIAKPVFLVRGLPAEKEKLHHSFSNLFVYNHLESEPLAELISTAEMVICRSGYSTLMDLTALKKHAVVVPTPGQKEQEYLAEYNDERKLFAHLNEKEFRWENVLKKNSQFIFSENWPEVGINESVISEFINSLRI